MKFRNTFTVIIFVSLFVSGCDIPEEVVPEKVIPNEIKKQEEPEIPEPVAESSSNKYTGGMGGENDFESARVWAQKHRKLTEQYKSLQKENDKLKEDNKRLIRRAELSMKSLKRTEQELEEANELLIEMRKELDGWKTNVLGFREEINFVHKEQLEALEKILKLLGYEYEVKDDNKE